MKRSNLAALLLVLGCGRPYLDDDPLLAPGADGRFRVVEPLGADALSRAPPVAPEAAEDPTLSTILAAANAPAAMDLSLDEARRDALARNLDLRVQLLGPRIAQEGLDAERAKFEAAFFTDLRAEGFDSTISADADLDTATLEPGIKIPLRTGGTAAVGLPFTFTETTADDAAESALRFSLSQPLLRGGGVGVATASIQVARFTERQEEARAKLTAIRVLALAERAYWELYAATREVEIRHDQYDWAVEQVEQARRLASAGAVPEIEVLRASAGVARRLDAVIVAETIRRRAETALKRVLNRPDLPVESRTVFRLVTEPRPRGLDLDPLALAAHAVANRMEMLELEVQLSLDAIGIDLARNNKLPIFAFDFSYTFKGSESSVLDSVGAIAALDFADWTVGAFVEVPLGNRAAEARFRQAVLTRAQTLATKDQRELQIREEVRNALDQLQQDWELILSARKGTILEGRNYEAEKRQFQAGVRTSTDVLEAAAFLADARSREARSLADYQISLVELAFATGTTLGQAQVDWPALNPPAGGKP